MHTNRAIAYYFRLDPAISDSTTGFFYTKLDGGDEYIRFEPTDISLYDKDDTEHVGWFWQPYENGKPTWMMPYHNLNNDVLMISYVIPLYYEDLFIGVVGMDFDYTDLIERVHEIKIYANGFAHLEVNGEVMHQNGRITSNNSEEEHTRNENEYLYISSDLINGMTLVLSASYDDIRHIRYDIALPILYTVLILGALFSIIVILMVKKIVNPLRKLTEASKKLAGGDYAVDIVDSNTYEIKMLSTAFENMTMHLREHEKLQYLLAYRDSLTGLRNTTSYKVWLNDFDKEIKEGGSEEFGVIVLDMNYLKETNDRYGHDAGNKLITHAAQIISGVFRRSPVFRIGGDEFLVILQNRDVDRSDELLERLDFECRGAYVSIGENEVPISIARGFAVYDPEKDGGFQDVFNRADDAMYRNKRKMKSEQA
jgi:diguanylate cyclase (GGDEF)-like protein